MPTNAAANKIKKVGCQCSDGADMHIGKRSSPFVLDKPGGLLYGPLIKRFMLFDEAEHYVSGLEIAGLTGWRIPTLPELKRIVAPAGHLIEPANIHGILPKVSWRFAVLHTSSKVFGRDKDPLYARHFWMVNLATSWVHNGYGDQACVVPVRGFKSSSVAASDTKVW